VNLQRALVIGLSLLLPGLAHSQESPHWAYHVGPTSVAVHTAAVMPFTALIVNADGSPAVGVPFTYRT
jgi:hypothetical protein